jgi:hypothetical protein
MNEEALRRELRRRIYEGEAQILANAEPDPELEAWLLRTSRNPLQLD